MIETPVTYINVIGATYYNGSGTQIPKEVNSLSKEKLHHMWGCKY